jgi:hypothetical protein
MGGAPYNVFGASGLEGAKAGLPQMIIYYQYLQNEITRILTYYLRMVKCKVSFNKTNSSSRGTRTD